MSDTFDAARVMAEIKDEVARRRAAGDFPPSLERELDLAFDRYVPAGSVSSDFSEAVRAADRAAYINVAVPTESQKPGVGEVKRVLRKAMAWYLNYLAQQTTAFATASVRAMRSLGERLDLAEASLAELRPAEDDAADRPAIAPDLSAWRELCIGRLPKRGRVLLTECGDGALLRDLVAAGVDAYGVEPRGPLVDAAAAAGLEAWPDDPFAHMRAVADGYLAGLVLSGCIDRMNLARQRLMVQMTAAKLAPGAPLVLIATDPAAWSTAVHPLEADLAPGRPLHASTWAHLLERAGFTEVEIHPAGVGAAAGTGSTSGDGAEGRRASRRASRAAPVTGPSSTTSAVTARRGG